jgi:hypothetical protein
MDIKYSARAIKHIYPNAEFVIYGDTLDGLQFIDPIDLEITQSEIDAAIEQIKADEITQAQEKAAAKASAQAKLAALGLTVEDLTALGL